MSEFHELRVGDHIALLSGYPFNSEYFDQEEGIRLIRIRDLHNPDGETYFRGPFDPKWVVKSQDILIGMDGDFNIVRWKGSESLLNQRILKAEAKSNGLIDEGYFFYWCAPLLKQIHNQTAATTVKHLSVKDIERAKGRFPDKRSQARIAEILSTLDEAIEQTEALIAKMQQVKAGLMHDLFTRGVTPDGRLRPTREQAPELYKESPIGWIPREWDCLMVDQLLAKTACPMRSGPFGSALLKDELVEEGIPFLGIDNIFVERFSPNFYRFVSERKFQELIRYSVFPRDVIITIMGTVGRCCVVPDDVAKALSSKHLWTMTFYAERVLPELVCWQLNHASWVKSWFARHSQGAVMEAIQSSTLRNLNLPVPPMEEQRLFLERYLECCKAIEAEEESIAKQRQEKQGLMRDLLAGGSIDQISELQEGYCAG